MKIINWFTDKYLLGGTMLTSIGCLIYGFLILLFLLFDVNPYYQSKNIDLGYNMKDGLEIEVRDEVISDKDTTILYKTQKGKQGKTESLDSTFMNKTIGNDSIMQLDTILRTYETFN